MLGMNLPDLIIVVSAVLICLTVHECAHAYVALKLGDDTAARMGRLSLNPIMHIDPFGLLLLILARFGWAKPVIIDQRNLKHPVRDDTIIALAGPAANLAFAFLLTGLLKLLLTSLNIQSEAVYRNIFTVFFTFIQINVGLGIFNLLPFPPLDGSHLIMHLLRKKDPALFYNFYRYGTFILLGIILFERFFNVDILPIGKAISAILYFYFGFFGM